MFNFVCAIENLAERGLCVRAHNSQPAPALGPAIPKVAMSVSPTGTIHEAGKGKCRRQEQICSICGESLSTRAFLNLEMGDGCLCPPVH